MDFHPGSLGSTPAHGSACALATPSDVQEELKRLEIFSNTDHPLAL